MDTFAEKLLVILAGVIFVLTVARFFSRRRVSDTGAEAALLAKRLATADAFAALERERDEARTESACAREACEVERRKIEATREEARGLVLALNLATRDRDEARRRVAAAEESAERSLADVKELRARLEQHASDPSFAIFADRATWQRRAQEAAAVLAKCSRLGGEARRLVEDWARRSDW